MERTGEKGRAKRGLGWGDRHPGLWCLASTLTLSINNQSRSTWPTFAHNLQLLKRGIGTQAFSKCFCLILAHGPWKCTVPSFTCNVYLLKTRYGLSRAHISQVGVVAAPW